MKYLPADALRYHRHFQALLLLQRQLLVMHLLGNGLLLDPNTRRCPHWLGVLWRLRAGDSSRELTTPLRYRAEVPMSDRCFFQARGFFRAHSNPTGWSIRPNSFF